MRKEKFKIILKTIIIMIECLLIMGLENQSFGIVEKPKNFINQLPSIPEFARVSKIVSNNLEWCIYLAFVAIFMFLISLVGIIILKSQNKDNKLKKIFKIMLVLSIICILVIGIIFVIYAIDLRDLVLFFSY